MSERLSRVYEELANHHHYQGEAQVRDRMLLLAADAALTEGRQPDAERLRVRLLELNPHHLLKPFPNLAQAMRSPDVSSYVEGLRRTYPPAQVEQMWSALRGAKPEAAPTVTHAQPPPTAMPVAPAIAPAIPIAPAVAVPVAPALPVQPPVSVPPPPPPPEPFVASSEPLSTRPRRRQEAGWLAPLLFVVVMVGAFVLALYTLVRPILQL
ncbi:MAG: hypothetical protein AB7K24_00880 [Gemmataceae bacterium]